MIIVKIEQDNAYGLSISGLRSMIRLTDILTFGDAKSAS